MLLNRYCMAGARLTKMVYTVSRSMRLAKFSLPCRLPASAVCTSPFDFKRMLSVTEAIETEKTSAQQSGEVAIGENEELKNKGNFKLFSISKDTQKNLKANGINYLFPVQTETFNSIVQGEDVIVKSKTGTGKTLAFLVPIVERILKNEETFSGSQVLILAPTRELTKQISDCVCKVTKKFTSVAIYGGTRIEKQLSELKKNPTFIVSTPGRLLDLLQNWGFSLNAVKFVVIDECDRMLDMGFLPDVDTIMSYMYNSETDKPQTLIFSATVPDDIQKSINKYIGAKACKVIDMIGKGEMKTPASVKHLAIECSYWDRPLTIANILRVYCGEHKQAIVFCEKKREADTLSTSQEMNLDCHVLHGDIPQETREKVMQGFRNGKYRVLVTTDVAARGLDIPDVDLVVVSSPPVDSDNYVHRSGRTGRAGREGICICLYTKQQTEDLRQLEKHTGVKFEKVQPPSGDKVLTASSGDAIKSLTEVPEDVCSQFSKAAQDILTRLSAEQALSAALAVICGFKDGKKLSLLGCQEGYTSFVLKTSFEVRGCGPLFSMLKQFLGEDFIHSQNKAIGKIMFSTDKTSTYFDLKSDYEEVLLSKWTDNAKFQLSLAESIPENLLTKADLNPSDQQDGRQNWRNNRGGYSGGNNRGNWNDRSNSFNRKRPMQNGFGDGGFSKMGNQKKVTKIASDD